MTNSTDTFSLSTEALEEFEPLYYLNMTTDWLAIAIIIIAVVLFLLSLFFAITHKRKINRRYSFPDPAEKRSRKTMNLSAAAGGVLVFAMVPVIFGVVSQIQILSIEKNWAYDQVDVIEENLHTDFSYQYREKIAQSLLDAANYKGDDTYHSRIAVLSSGTAAQVEETENDDEQNKQQGENKEANLHTDSDEQIARIIKIVSIRKDTSGMLSLPIDREIIVSVGTGQTVQHTTENQNTSPITSGNNTSYEKQNSEKESTQSITLNKNTSQYSESDSRSDNSADNSDSDSEDKDDGN